MKALIQVRFVHKVMRVHQIVIAQKTHERAMHGRIMEQLNQQTASAVRLIPKQ